jgi:hypothetical protein
MPHEESSALSDIPANLSKTSYYFVDEAGDLTLFDKYGRVIIGTDGVSKCFVVAAVLIADPTGLAASLESLRERLMKDPYFAGVPSMAITGGKTARAFHAKDDVAEVRREVFSLLRDAGGVEVYAAFRRKNALAADARARFEREGVKFSPEDIYDNLVTSIFTNRLHVSEANHITFARRGKSDRNAALMRAIEQAKRNFEGKWRKGVDRPTTIESNTPAGVAGLQVVDYYLWAFQRLLEREEDRYFNLLAPAYRLIIDRDDARRAGYGEYYTATKHPLTLNALMPVT